MVLSQYLYLTQYSIAINIFRYAFAYLKAEPRAGVTMSNQDWEAKLEDEFRIVRRLRWKPLTHAAQSQQKNMLSWAIRKIGMGELPEQHFGLGRYIAPRIDPLSLCHCIPEHSSGRGSSGDDFRCKHAQP
jgi:hypothetical protein